MLLLVQMKTRTALWSLRLPRPRMRHWSALTHLLRPTMQAVDVSGEDVVVLASAAGVLQLGHGQLGWHHHLARRREAGLQHCRRGRGWVAVSDVLELLLLPSCELLVRC